MSRPIDALLDYLRDQERRGVSHVHVDPDAREILRNLHQRGKSAVGNPAARSTDRARSATPAAASEPPSSARPPERPAASPLRLRDLAEPAAAAPILPAGFPALAIEGSDNAAKIAGLRRQAEQWPPARALGTLRDTMVFSTGNPEARIVFVGEAPGYQEERKREPFVGPAGEKFNMILKAMGIDRSEVYITNIVKFRPGTPSQTTNNRKPTPEEMAACLPFVLAEIDIIRPQCLVALGGTAAEALLATDQGVGQLRNRWHELQGIPLRVTYHPSYLLHNENDTTEKRKVWEDMLAVMEQLGLPISPKQRTFFLPKA